MSKVLSPKDFAKNYGEIFEGNEIWRNLNIPDEKLYSWDKDSTYIKEAPFFYNISDKPQAMQRYQSGEGLAGIGRQYYNRSYFPGGISSMKLLPQENS